MSELNRAHNFNAGPAGLPLEVMQTAQAELLDYKGSGMSIMEMSHRSKEFEAMINEAEADMRELLGIPANYKIMFLQGGASLQFAMLAMNLRPAGASADFLKQNVRPDPPGGETLGPRGSLDPLQQHSNPEDAAPAQNQ